MEPNLPVDPIEHNKSPISTADSKPKEEIAQKTPTPGPRFKPILGNVTDAPPKAAAPSAPNAQESEVPISVKSVSQTPKEAPKKGKTSYMVSGVRKAEVNVQAATASMEQPSRWPLYGTWIAVGTLFAFSLWQNQRISSLSQLPSSGDLTSQSDSSKETVNQLLARAEKAENHYQDLLAQFNASNKRLEQAEQINTRLNAQVKDLVTQFNLNQHLAKPITGDSEGLDSASLNMADLSPAHRELLLVKERNRITAFADAAIATGEREPYDRLWVIIDNPELASLAHAARAEILRVQNYYLSGSRISRYEIVVGNYFPDQASLKDHQLNEAQLITLLKNKDAPWQVRLKAAHLLGRRKSLSSAEALAKAIKEDKNLDVVKEATFSFEQITGYHARIFQYDELADWWTEYKKQGSDLPGAPATPQAVSSDKTPEATAKEEVPKATPVTTEPKKN